MIIHVVPRRLRRRVVVRLPERLPKRRAPPHRRRSERRRERERARDGVGGGHRVVHVRGVHHRQADGLGGGQRDALASVAIRQSDRSDRRDRRGGGALHRSAVVLPAAVRESREDVSVILLLAHRGVQERESFGGVADERAHGVAVGEGGVRDGEELRSVERVRGGGDLRGVPERRGGAAVREPRPDARGDGLEVRVEPRAAADVRDRGRARAPQGGGEGGERVACARGGGARRARGEDERRERVVGGGGETRADPALGRLLLGRAPPRGAARVAAEGPAHRHAEREPQHPGEDAQEDREETRAAEARGRRRHREGARGRARRAPRASERPEGTRAGVGTIGRNEPARRKFRPALHYRRRRSTGRGAPTPRVRRASDRSTEERKQTDPPNRIVDPSPIPRARKTRD